MKQISLDEWVLHGCFIQKQEPHPKLYGKYEVFKNDKERTHVGRANTMREAKYLSKNNRCNENYLKF